MFVFVRLPVHVCVCAGVSEKGRWVLIMLNACCVAGGYRLATSDYGGNNIIYFHNITSGPTYLACSFPYCYFSVKNEQIR